MWNKGPCLAVCGLGLAAVLSTAWADSNNDPPEPLDLLKQMTQANRKLNYDGVFLYQRARLLASMRIIHRGGDRGLGEERMISPTGLFQEVVRDRQGLSCLIGSKQGNYMLQNLRSPHQGEVHLPAFLERAAELEQYYQIELAGERRGAGRDVWVVNVRPRDRWRYGYQFWIDKETQLLLSYEMKNLLGYSIEQIRFNSLRILPYVPEQLLKPRTPPVAFAHVMQEQPMTESPAWHFDSLPDGFTLSAAGMRTVSINDKTVSQLILSDGLASISVFIEESEDDGAAENGFTSLAGTNVYTMSRFGQRITVLGAVPLPTVRRIAASIRARDAKEQFE